MKNSVAILFFFVVNVTAYAQKNQLAHYLNQAKANSPLLKDYQNQVRSALYDSLLIRAAYKPQVTANSLNTYSPVYRGWGYDAAITNGGNFSASVGVNKLLLNKKVIAAQFESLQLQNQSLNNSSKITEQDLKRAITAQYITAWGDLQQLNFDKEINTLLSHEEAILKKLTQQNVYKQVDYLAFLVTLQQQEFIMQQQYIQFKFDYAGLNYLSGITDTTTVDLQKPDLTLSQLPDMAQSVFFKQYELDSLKLNNSKAIIAMAYKPRFNLFADGGFLSSLAYNPYKNFGTSFGISAVIPIYDGRQMKLQYSKIALAQKTRESNKFFFTGQYQQQIAQLTQQLHATEELVENIKAQLKYTKSLIEVNGKLLDVGEVRVTDYILALNNYITAMNLVTQNNISCLQIVNQLNYWNR